MSITRGLDDQGTATMNEWQRTFLQKLESAKRQWLHKFEQFATDIVEPVFLLNEEFTSTHGFRVSRQPCEPGHRIYKFAITENGYLLITLRMRGLEEVEVSTEVFVPGLGGREPAVKRTTICEATEPWVEAQFQAGLDRFIALFGEAGATAADHAETLVPA